MALAKLRIGTVNFGMPYGMVPGSGKVPAAAAAAIVEAALRDGVDRFDTAIGYGNAESVLGDALRRAGARGAKVGTKILPLPDGRVDADTAASIAAQARQARDRLDVDKLDALLVHRTADLVGPDGPRLWEVLRQIQADGITERIGVSVYHAAEIDAVLARCKPDVVQLPLSIADQRLIRSGHLAALAAKGVEIHARSVFLQGVLLAGSCAAGDLFAPVSVKLAALETEGRRAKADRLALCLGFVMGLAEVAQVVVGVNSLEHFRAVAAAADAPVNVTKHAAYACAWHDEQLLNPSNWAQLKASSG